MAAFLSKAKILIDERKVFMCLENLEHCEVLLSHIIIEELSKACRQKLSSVEKFLICDSCTSFVWERLNTGHWSDVSLVWRQLFSLGMILKIHAVAEMFLENTNPVNEKTLIEDIIKMCDVALFMGSPVKSLENLCSEMASLMSHYLNCENSIEITPNHQPKKIRIDNGIYLSRFSNISELLCIEDPNIETFLKFKNEKYPVLIRKAIDDWPALDPDGDNRWSVDYLKQAAGYRTVPIELGKRYTDDNWTQKLMTIRDFIEKYIETDTNGVGYLAQYELFDQIPELKDDFEVPALCYTESDDVNINCWIGPKNTVSPLHTDPKHNLLVQVLGSKHVILFQHDQSEYLHAFEEGILENTSKINLEDEESNITKSFPKFSNARGFECILQPGDMLYIPPKCWHFVKSLEISFSINFWFD